MKKKLSKKDNEEKFGTKFQRGKMVFNKWRNKDEKEERVSLVPRSVKVRRAGGIIGWVVFISFGVHACTGPDEQKSEATEVKKPTIVQKQNEAASQVAVQFAKDFAEKYFFWSTGDKGEEYRVKDMKTFLAQGLDPYAGLDMSELKSDSHLLESKLKSIKEISKDKAEITLVVKYEITTKEEAGDDESPAKSEKKVITKGFVVPVQYNNTHVVYELPTFANIQNTPTLKADNDNDLKEASNNKDVQNITNFLNTFFSSYSQDTKDKLSYILDDEKHKDGLGKSFNFVEVKESEIYEGKKENEFIVACETVFQDPDSQSKFTTHYDLTVVKKDGHYIVSKIN